MSNQFNQQNFPQQQTYPQQNFWSPDNQSQFQYQNTDQQQNTAQQGNTTMQIKNQQTGQLPTVKGPDFNDRDMLNDMLATEKHLSDNFNVFVREASYRDLHNDVMQILNQTHYEARSLYNMMFNLGWYSLQTESTQQVAQAQQQFSNYQSQFANTNDAYTNQNQMF